MAENVHVAIKIAIPDVRSDDTFLLWLLLLFVLVLCKVNNYFLGVYCSEKKNVTRNSLYSYYIDIRMNFETQ